MRRKTFFGRILLAALGVGATGVGLPVRVGARQQDDEPLGAPRWLTKEEWEASLLKPRVGFRRIGPPGIMDDV